MLRCATYGKHKTTAICHMCVFKYPRVYQIGLSFVQTASA